MRRYVERTCLDLDTANSLRDQWDIEASGAPAIEVGDLGGSGGEDQEHRCW
jgi:hypothetical protein